MNEIDWKELAERFKRLRAQKQVEPSPVRKRRPRPIRRDGRSIREWLEGEAQEEIRQARIRLLTRLYQTHLEKNISRVRLITPESKEWKYFEDGEAMFTATGFPVHKWDLWMEAQFAMMPVVTKSKKMGKSFRRFPAPCNLFSVKGGGACKRFIDYTRSLEKRYPAGRIPPVMKKEEEFIGGLRDGFYNGYEFLIRVIRTEKLTPELLLKIFEMGAPCFRVAFILSHPLILPSALAGDFSVFKSPLFQERIKRDFEDILSGNRELLQKIANLRKGIKENVRKLMDEMHGEVNDNVYELL